MIGFGCCLMVWYDYFMNKEHFEKKIKLRENINLWIENGDLDCAGDIIGS